MEDFFAGLLKRLRPRPPLEAAARRNQACPCGSGRKYKRCCMERDAWARRLLRRSRG
jgi:hypothetical protein